MRGRGPAGGLPSMMVRAVSFAVALVAACVPALAIECREITRSTYIETRYPNGAVTMDRVDAGKVFFTALCSPEGARLWCYMTEVEHTVFTMRRFIEADRMEYGHSRPVDFDVCLAN